MRRAVRTILDKSGIGPLHSKTLRKWRRFGKRASVMECGSPMPLYANWSSATDSFNHTPWELARPHRIEYAPCQLHGKGPPKEKPRAKFTRKRRRRTDTRREELENSAMEIMELSVDRGNRFAAHSIRNSRSQSEAQWLGLSNHFPFAAVAKRTRVARAKQPIRL